MSTRAHRVRSLTVAYRTNGGRSLAVHDVDLELRPGRIIGLVGESGSGKSTLGLAAMGYLAPNAERVHGVADLDSIDVFADPGRSARHVWGQRIAYLAQDAARSLTPTQRVGEAFAESMRHHLGLSREDIKTSSAVLLRAVGIADAENALARYPHQFSGGQQQRIALALALAPRPDVLILDEPTTGLDVTTQAQIVDLIVQQVRQRQLATLAISHDLALLANMCDDLTVMYAGQIVERGTAAAVVGQPRHPYTRGLIGATPNIESAAVPTGLDGRQPPSAVLNGCAFASRCTHATPTCSAVPPTLDDLSDEADAVHLVRCHYAGRLSNPNVAATKPRTSTSRGDSPVLEVAGLTCWHGATTVVDDVSFTAGEGEVLCIVGESGSGKTTTLRAIAGLHLSTTGSMVYCGEPLARTVRGRGRHAQRELQLVFQNPDASLNPRQTIARAIGRPIGHFFPEIGPAQRHARVLELLDAVRLDPACAARRPHELSGGQRQRVALARAFAARPRLLLCDEVVTALDVSVQAVVLELLVDLAQRENTTVLFVTHDLGVVRSIADNVLVMRHGAICERGSASQIFDAADHPYTQSLLAAVPRLTRCPDRAPAHEEMR